MSFHRLQVEACKASSCLFKNDSTGCFRSTLNNFISVNQGDAACRLMLFHCKTIVAISIPVMFFYWNTEKYRNRFMCQWIFMNLFQQYSTAFVCKWFASFFKRRKKSCIIFSIESMALQRWADCEIFQSESNPDPQNFWKSLVRSSPDPPI